MQFGRHIGQEAFSQLGYDLAAQRRRHLAAGIDDVGQQRQRQRMPVGQTQQRCVVVTDDAAGGQQLRRGRRVQVAQRNDTRTFAP